MQTVNQKLLFFSISFRTKVLMTWLFMVWQHAFLFSVQLKFSTLVGDVSHHDCQPWKVNDHHCREVNSLACCAHYKMALHPATWPAWPRRCKLRIPTTISYLSWPPHGQSLPCLWYHWVKQTMHRIGLLLLLEKMVNVWSKHVDAYEGLFSQLLRLRVVLNSFQEWQ